MFWLCASTVDIEPYSSLRHQDQQRLLGIAIELFVADSNLECIENRKDLLLSVILGDPLDAEMTWEILCTVSLIIPCKANDQMVEWQMMSWLRDLTDMS